MENLSRSFINCIKLYLTVVCQCCRSNTIDSCKVLSLNIWSTDDFVSWEDLTYTYLWSRARYHWVKLIVSGWGSFAQMLSLVLQSYRSVRSWPSCTSMFWNYFPVSSHSGCSSIPQALHLNPGILYDSVKTRI